MLLLSTSLLYCITFNPYVLVLRLNLIIIFENLSDSALKIQALSQSNINLTT